MCAKPLDMNWQASDTFDVNARFYRSYYEKRNTTTMVEFADFGYPTQEASGASGMSANVDIKSFEAWATKGIGDNHLLTFGAEVRDEDREATVFSQGPGFDARSVSYNAFYLQDEWTISDSVNITLGGRYDGYQQESYVDSSGTTRDANENNESTFRVGMVKNFSKAANLRVNFAQAYRVPDIRELFIQKQTPAGLQLGAQAVSPMHGKEAYDLQPENTDAFEIGLSGSIDSFSYEVSLFLNQIDNRIQQIVVDSNNDGRDDYFTFENVADAQTSGLELTLSYMYSDTLDFQFFWTELDTENKTTGKDLQFNPERNIAFNVNWQPFNNTNLGLSSSYTGEQFYIQNGQDLTSNAYTLINLNGSYRFSDDSNFELFGGIDNIFDEEVDKRLGSNVGTYLFLGFRANF